MEEQPTWAELRGDGGLTSKHWRTRLAAIQSLLALADQSSLMDDAPLTQLLDLLIFTVALSDAHSLVRKNAAECASKMFNMMHDHLSPTELDRYLSGFLAISVDNEREVQSAAAEALWSSSMGLGHQRFKEMVPRLAYRFVSTALHSMKIIQMTPTTTYFGGISNSFDMSVMVPALEGVINIEQFCRSVSIPEAIELEIGPPLVPLLVATLAALLEESEISRDQTGARKVSQLLRALGSSKYRQHITSMISSQLYDGMALARWYRISASVDDEVLDLLEKVNISVVLKGVYIALETASHPRIKDPETADIEDVENRALRHIIETLQIPPTLVKSIPETRDKILEEKFVNSSYYYLKVAEAILKGMSIDMIHGDIVQDLVLCCSALASTEDKNLSWIIRDIEELASGIVKCLGTMLAKAQLQAQIAKVKTDVDDCVERLILTLLPDLISKLKGHLRDHLRDNDDGSYGNSSSSASLATAIIASHQLYWCLKQVLHPHLSQSCVVIMPCALMALDHYSPDVKRQAMKLFIHLTDNLNPSELRWYKDAVLDCIIRNIVGCGDLWPLVVQTAIQLVLRIEGSNPRSKWYRNILNEMLSELERHQLDAIYFKVWMENIGSLFEAMGLVLVAHFKRLLSLLFLWLHTSDDSITLLVLNLLKMIAKYTWPRIPFYAERFWNELSKVYNESFNKKEGLAIRSSVLDVAVLLHL
ncbi:hypothetical protein GOP47_0010749 [Adiantum capillus-veneris]|uniref:Uncharacterized protein n=1 Tax=Adiantum capillus-veneris TaxID=13818 RepID=A0A9D4UVI3_ADICA|nr:hypothetical protein GOP47_0010749 [Adiantum capillus-veneris]